METNALSLIVKEKTLGSLITNAKDIKNFVEEKLKTYSVDNYKGDEKQASKDKAELNAAAKQLNDERIKLEKEWLEPFQEFKDVVTETTNMIKTASSKLDAIVKAKEEIEKNKKREEIEKLYTSKNFTLVNLERIFNSKWLNKTYKMANIDAEIEQAITQIKGDLQSLDAFGEDTAILKDLYLSTLNLQVTLNKGAELKANRERLKQAEEQKQAEENAKKQALQNESVEEKAQNTATTESVENVSTETSVQTNQNESVAQINANCPIYAFNVFGSISEVESVKAIANEMQLEIVPSITLKGNAKQINQFKELLAENGIEYTKQAIINLLVKRV